MPRRKGSARQSASPKMRTVAAENFAVLIDREQEEVEEATAMLPRGR